MAAFTVGIAGAGLLGRLLAWRLARSGLRVEVFDPAPGPQPRFGAQGEAQHAAGFTAAGMLSPLAELDNAGPEVAALGWRSIDAWRDIVQELAEFPELPGMAPPAFAQRGSLLLAHRSDLGSAQRVLARLARAPAGHPPPRALAAAELVELEPALQGAAHAWLLPGEAQIDSVQAMLALQAQAEAAGAVWHWGRRVAEVLPGRLALAEGGAQAGAGAAAGGGDTGAADDAGGADGGGVGTIGAAGMPSSSSPSSYSRRDFNLAIDVRGVGARPALPVRGVRGEMVWLRLPGHGLRRPVRLLHPRHRVYIVPRASDTVLVGASEIESEDRSEVSLRSAVELMSAAHSVMPALAEARILRLDSNLRPALPDNDPLIDATTPGLLRINGLFRHGWLLAPALVEDALATCGLERQQDQQRQPAPETAVA